MCRGGAGGAEGAGATGATGARVEEGAAKGDVGSDELGGVAPPSVAPGTADSPGPMKVPAEQLRHLLGITGVNYVQGRQALAVIDSPLS